jgi:hypothetical protein
LRKKKKKKRKKKKIEKIEDSSWKPKKNATPQIRKQSTEQNSNRNTKSQTITPTSTSSTNQRCDSFDFPHSLNLHGIRRLFPLPIHSTWSPKTISKHLQGRRTRSIRSSQQDTQTAEPPCLSHRFQSAFLALPHPSFTIFSDKLSSESPQRFPEV